MTRSVFMRYNLKNQRAIFNAMSPNQRFLIWDEKLSNILSLDWSDAEIANLEKLKLYLNNKIIFDDNARTDKELDDFLIFMYKWCEYSKNNFQWDDTSINNICTDPNDVSKDANGVITVNAEDLNYPIKLISTTSECNTNCNTTMNWCANRDMPEFDIYYDCKTSSDCGGGFKTRRKSGMGSK